jgi:hypothetical protein
MWTTTNQQGVFCDADCTKGAHVVVPVTRLVGDEDYPIDNLT